MRPALIAIGLAGGCAAGPPAPAGPDATGAPDAPPPDPADAPPPAPISVLTVNLRTALLQPDDAEARTAIVIALIDGAKPDVVALQEVTQSPTLANRAQVIADATGYAWVWEPTHELVIGQEGIAILARGEILWHDAQELPHTELALLHRAVLGAKVATANGPVELYATHLTVAGSIDDRADQAEAVLDFIAAHHGDAPAFLAGDLNAEPDELAMVLLRDELTDAWPEVSALPGHTIPSTAPERRIDYIYAVPTAGISATPITCATVLAEPVGGVMASDHLGVACRFVFPAGGG
jgi:endonuclease/exonuclease/phosphatase family metal-dependent hydrolase